MTATVDVSLPRYPSGKINVDELVKHYAKDNDMSYSTAVRWMSDRTSLQVCAEVMGIPLSSGVTSGRPTETDLRTLNQLGEFLDRKGYSVPRLMDLSAESYQPSRVDDRNEEGGRVSDITKEKYLEIRLSGVSRTRAVERLGVSTPTLYAFLAQWGIKDRDVEEKVLAEMKAKSVANACVDYVRSEVAATTESANANSQQNNSQPSVDKPPQGDMYVTVRIPVRLSQLPENFKVMSPELNEKYINRDKMIGLGVWCLGNAAAWACHELEDIMGQEVNARVLEAFLNRKCQVLAEQEWA